MDVASSHRSGPVRRIYKITAPKLLRQQTVTSFFDPLPEGQKPEFFIAKTDSEDVDDHKSSPVALKKRRGRPTKLETLTKKVKAEAKVVDLDEPKLEQIEDQKKRFHYSKISYKKKLEVLDEYQAFLHNPPIINGKRQSFNDFVRTVAVEKSMTEASTKRLCLDFEKKPAILVQLQRLCSNDKSARGTGHLFTREPRLTYGREIDNEIADWVHASLELGYSITRDLLHRKALELITPTVADFKATSSWIDCFLSRHILSLRKLNQKCFIQDSYLQTISEKFKIHTRDLINKYKISPEFIVNVDETPYYWEYLPRKVVTSTLSTTAQGWKRGYTHARSTVVLAATAAGSLLRPTLVLKRETPYQLKCRNELNLLITNTTNGWVKEDTFILWLKETLLPYVKKNQCLLLMDSYEAHISPKVTEFFKSHQNIHPAIIVGGTTSSDQPLDVKINKAFKDKCKHKSFMHANAMMYAINQYNGWEQKQQATSNKFQLINNQILIAEKDRNRKKGRQATVCDFLSKITIEDIYSFINYGFQETIKNKELIRSSFTKCGYIDALLTEEEEIDELSNGIESIVTDDDLIAAEAFLIDDDQSDDEIDKIDVENNE